jgi:SAM-dependent methyltransferase
MSPAPPEGLIDAWIADARRRNGDLATRDLRRGIQAVSGVYVEGRQQGELGSRATRGPARRAAFASYFAPLHFLTTWHLLESGEFGSLPDSARILDLGCGTGAVGAALALRRSPTPPIEAIDALGWALGEARRTFAHFGLRARTRRARLPRGLPAPRAGDLIVCGWFANECSEEERAQLLDALERGLERGAGLLVLEPLAERAVPWWSDWRERLAARGLASGLFRQATELPEALSTLDRASGLDHSELGVRWIAGVDAGHT